MIICKLYDHNGIKLNDKKEVQLILGVIGRRDTFQDSSVSYRISIRLSSTTTPKIQDTFVLWVALQAKGSIGAGPTGYPARKREDLV